MFAKASIIAMAALVAGVYAESHQVTLINNCGSGTPVYATSTSGQQTFQSGVSDRILGGVAWMSDYKDCGFSGLNCGTVEFTLTDPGNPDGNDQNAANYSLLDGKDKNTGGDLGNHKFQYNMHYKFTGSCSNDPGVCTGDSAQACPGAYLDSETEGGRPEQCRAVSTGIEITFC